MSEEIKSILWQLVKGYSLNSFKEDDIEQAHSQIMGLFLTKEEIGDICVKWYRQKSKHTILDLVQRFHTAQVKKEGKVALLKELETEE